jgi:hypothetical protein
MSKPDIPSTLPRITPAKPVIPAQHTGASSIMAGESPELGSLKPVDVNHTGASTLSVTSMLGARPSNPGQRGAASPSSRVTSGYYLEGFGNDSSSPHPSMILEDHEGKPWAVPKEKQAEYGNFFASIDTTNKGYLTGKTLLCNVFLSGVVLCTSQVHSTVEFLHHLVPSCE